MFVEILNSHKSQHSFEIEDELMLSNELLAGSSSSAPRSKTTPEDSNTNKKRNKSSFFLDERLKDSWSKADWWKVQLGKYLRVSIKEARIMGLHIPENIYNELHKIGKL
jgi:hypothetical protein